MTGLELTRQLRERGHTLPVILLSGVSSELLDEEVRAAGVTRVLGKPISTHDLASAIRETLDRGAGTPSA
jgi:CheY-like chemotaxis protein